MREIKFRAFYKPQKIMIGFEELCSRFNRFEILTQKGLFKDFVLMQYTGLKDKNGKDIYEGDILGNDGVVVWNESCACFGYELNGEVIVRPWSLKNEEYEVIGNIYENKEMLK
jgi:uncharacterized phage protein (TIGR01671 family)